MPRLTGELPSGTPSLTRVFSLKGRNLRAAQEAANKSAPEVSPQKEPTPAQLSPWPDDHGPRGPIIEGTPEDVHAVGYLWLHVCGKYLQQRLLAHALNMAARRRTILILAEAQSKAGLEDPPFLDYTRHVVLPAHEKMGAGLDVYVTAGTTARTTLI